MNNNIDYIYDLVRQACERESGINIVDKGLKLSEEVGELAAEILKLRGIKFTELNEQEIKKKILLESCDVLIMIFSIMYEMNFSKEEIVEMTKSQIEKWINSPKK
jgi:NTP pyrophosphatase (non-canonical NTP hydrolase)